jgi:hypothetical protein
MVTAAHFVLPASRCRWMVRNFYFHESVISSVSIAVFYYSARAENFCCIDGTFRHGDAQRTEQMRLIATVKIFCLEFSARCARLPFCCLIQDTRVSASRRLHDTCKGKKILNLQHVPHVAPASHFRQSRNESKQSLPKRHTIFAANTLCPRSVGVRGPALRPPRSLEGICE